MADLNCKNKKFKVEDDFVTAQITRRRIPSKHTLKQKRPFGTKQTRTHIQNAQEKGLWDQTDAYTHTQCDIHKSSRKRPFGILTERKRTFRGRRI